MDLHLTIPFVDLDLLKEALSSFQKKDKKKKNVIIALASPHYLLQTTSVSAELSDHEIIQWLKAQAVKFFGQPADQLCIDYVIDAVLSETEMQLTVAAAKKELINDIIECAKKSNMKLVSIQVDNQINLMDWRYQKEKNKNRWAMAWMFVFIAFMFWCFLFSHLWLKHDLYIQNQKINKLKIKIESVSLAQVKNDTWLFNHINNIKMKKIKSFQNNQAFRSKLFIIANALPNQMVLTGLTCTLQQILLTGLSDHLQDIHAYVNALKSSFHSKKIEIIRLKHVSGSSPSLQFVIRVVL